MGEKSIHRTTPDSLSAPNVLLDFNLLSMASADSATTAQNSDDVIMTVDTPNSDLVALNLSSAGVL